ncbi:MAG: response regulator [Deltaproteobacteria bacterium]|nr:response regulator [Deltaproteobacteria bacterium]
MTRVWRKGETQATGYTILVVDDQEEILISTRLLLEWEGHTVLTAAGGPEALALFRQQHVHLIIVDYFMPDMNGEQLVTEIRKLNVDVQILLQTGYAGERPPRAMLKTLDIQGYHNKTDGPEQFLVWVDVALKAATQLQRIRQSEQLKSELVMTISHELRTPLASLLGFSELMLMRDFAPEERRQCLAVIHKESARLSTLINNFLDLQRIEAGRQTYTFTHLALQPLLQDAVTVFTGQGTHSFQIEAPTTLPLVRADGDRLRQVLANLLSNAVKFSPEGGDIVVNARQKGNSVVVSITDHGIGIAQDDIEQLFTKFYRVDNRETRDIGGTGLGLALVKEIIEAHQGRVWVESEQGIGSSFFFTLPSIG